MHCSLRHPTEEHTIKPQPSTILLQAERLSLRLSQHELFSQLSLSIPPGVTLVRGEEGSGKTTLLRLLAGELAAQSGELRLNGVHQKASPGAYQQQVFWANPRSEAWEQTSPADYFLSLPRDRKSVV